MNRKSHHKKTKIAHKTGFARIAMIALGLLCLIFGIIGLVMPVLPTTPFLLAASYLFMRSSDRLYEWLMNHPWLGPYIYNYLRYRAIEKRTKYFALFMLWLTMTIAISIVKPIGLKVMLFAIAIGVTIHVGSLKTLTEEDMTRYEAEKKKIGRITRYSF